MWWTIVLTSLLVLTTVFCGMDIGVHLAQIRETPNCPKCEICEATSTQPEIIIEHATTTVIDESCALELQYCWTVANNKNCPLCEETQPLKDEITSLLISRDQCKQHELELSEQLKNCPNF